MDLGGIEEMLVDLGELLDARGGRFHLAVIGGTALLMRQVVSRTTRDVDVVGIEEDGLWVALDGLPEVLAQAVQDVALLHDEDSEWLNAKPSDLLRIGLPSGWSSRLSRRDYGRALSISVIGREDLVATKLYALTDQSPTSKHASDLLALVPDDEEIDAAAAWCRHQDPSSAFADQLQQAITWLRSQRS